MKMILQYDPEGNFVKTFKSINEAARSVGVERHTIRRALKDFRRVAGGYRWVSAKDREAWNDGT